MRRYLHEFADWPRLTYQPVAVESPLLALSDLLISRSDNLPGKFYSVLGQIACERNGYYAALEQAQTGTLDVTAWIEWFSAACAALCRARKASLPTRRAKRPFGDDGATSA